MNDTTPINPVEMLKGKGGKVRGVLISTAVLLSIAGAACSGVVAGAKLVYSSLTEQIAENHAEIVQESRQRELLATRVVVIETNATNLGRSIDEVRQKLDQVIGILIARQTVIRTESREAP